jgi:hypothetical protein
MISDELAAPARRYRQGALLPCCLPAIFYSDVRPVRCWRGAAESELASPFPHSLLLRNALI